MQWTDDAIVLGSRKHGETSVILEVLARGHGRHLGLVHGGRSRNLRAVLQAGNSIHATWRARLDEHLGVFAVEAETLRGARLLSSPIALYGLSAASALVRLIPERDPHPALFESLLDLVEHLDDADILSLLFVQFEMTILAELGFGLDLSRCTVTGRSDDLAYVSPKSGCAVSMAAGEPYKDRLLKLPSFLAGRGLANRPSRSDLLDGFRLTDYFLRQRLYDPRGQAPPEERDRFIALVTADE